MLERTTETGSISLGKYTFLMRWPLPTILFSVPDTVVAHQFQGSSAHRKKIWKEGRVLPLSKAVKTKGNTAMSSNGLSSDQKKPNTECLYRTLRSRTTRLYRRSR